MKKESIQFKDFEQIKDKYLGKPGTPERNEYEFDLGLEILGAMIQKTRKERNLTQEQLGQLAGVRKSEISKLEKSARNMTIGTVMRIFRAMNANIKFIVELDEKVLKTALP